MKYLFITLFSLCSFLVFAQKVEFEYQFRNYNVDDGLPSTQVYEILEDRDGYIWFGTDRGLVKYNGYGFKTYTVQDGLSTNVIFKLSKGPEGQLACYGKDRKIHFFNGRGFDPYKHNESLEDYITIDGNVESFNFYENQLAIFEPLSSRPCFQQNIETGEICFSAVKTELLDNHFGVHMALLPKDEGGRILNYQGKEILEIPSSSNFHYAECTKLNGVYFFSFSNLLYKYDPDKEKAEFVYLFEDEVTDLKPDEKHDNLFIVTIGDGAWRYENKKDKTPEKILNAKQCSNVLVDNAGGLWIASLFDGLYYRSQSLNQTKLLKESKEDKYVDFQVKHSSLYVKKSDNLIYKVHGDSLEALKQVEFLDSETSIDDYLIFLAGKDAWSNIVCDVSKNEFKQASLHANQLVYHDAAFYIVSRSFFYEYEMDGKSHRKYHLKDYLNSILFIGETTMLLATDNGVKILDLKDVKHRMGQVYYWPDVNAYRPDNHFFQKKVRSIIALGDSLRVYGGAEEGVYLEYLNGKDNIQIQKEDGLLSNEVETLSYGEGRLIVRTKQGISVVNENGSIKNYTRKNGLPSNEVYSTAIFNDTLWVTTRKGAVILIPEETISVAPPVIHSAMAIAGKNVPIACEYELDYSQDLVECSFEALSYEREDDLRYRYMLKGVDPGWVTTKNRTVRYMNLPYGDFSFWVAPEKIDNSFGKPVCLFSISRSRPFWEWKSFSVLLFMLIIGAFYIAVLRRFKRQRKKQEDKLIMLNLERKALQAQMNPHFMFNSLTSLQSLILDDKKTESHEFLERFARLTRQSLNHSTQNLITVHEEIEMLKLYMELEQIRFNQIFTYEIINNLERSPQKLAPMLIQPFVENAIIHGLANMKSPGKLSIVFQPLNDFAFTCTITDNGRGRKKSKSNLGRKSLGIQLVKDRLNILLNKSVGEPVKIIDLVENDIPCGTKVILTLPINPTVL